MPCDSRMEDRLFLFEDIGSKTVQDPGHKPDDYEDLTVAYLIDEQFRKGCADENYLSKTTL